MSGNRPAVTIFYDVPDWAFHNVARNIARVGAQDYSFRLLGRYDWIGKKQVVTESVMQSDIAVFLWRFDMLAFLDTLDAAAWAKIATRGGPAFVTIVYDHLYQSAEDLGQYGNPFELSDVVATCSERLRDVYARHPHLPDISHVVPDGVDLTFFSPTGRVFDAERPLRIGWVGNSEWGSTIETDLKGKHTVLEPAFAKLREAGLTFEIRVADRAVDRIPSEKMPDFYREIDVLVCTSAIEGTPNPVLEAMASGVAIVTTDVGIVHQVFGPEQMQFVLKHRCPEAVAEALERLILDRGLLKCLQDENIRQRETLSWKLRWPLWRTLFDDAKANATAEPQNLRAEKLQQFQLRRRSSLEQARRMVAGNQRLYWTYDIVRERCPGAIRLAKRILKRGYL